MKKLLGIIVLGLLLGGNAYAGKQDMISALKGIPGVADALWKDDVNKDIDLMRVYEQYVKDGHARSVYTYLYTF